MTRKVNSVPPFKNIPIVVNKKRNDLRGKATSSQTGYSTVSCGFIGLLRLFRPYLPLTNDAMPITVNGKQSQRMKHDGHYNSNHLFFVESHKCAPDSRI